MSIWPSLWITLAIQVLASLVLYVPPVLAPAAQGDVGVPASFVGIVTAAVLVQASGSYGLAYTVVAALSLWRGAVLLFPRGP